MMSNRTFFLSVLAAVGILSTALPNRVYAQSIAFTNDAEQLKNPARLADLTDAKELLVFKGGDAVWGVLRANPKFKNIAPYTSDRNGQVVVKVTVSLYNVHQNFDTLFTSDIAVTPEQVRNDFLAFVIVPDAFNLNAPGFESLLDRIRSHGNKKMVFKVRVEGSAKSGGNWIQSGFYIDLSGGLGRYADWIRQHTADRDKPLINARTSFVKGFASMREDPRLRQDITKWWNGSGTVVNPILKIFLCSTDYHIVRNRYGIVTSKQMCALYVTKRGSDGKCFVQWRNFGYESLGGGVFEQELKNWTPSDASIRTVRENLMAGHPYELECSAATR